MPVAYDTATGMPSQMRKLQITRRSFLIEPANPSTQTVVAGRFPRPSAKVSVLEIIGEIVSLIVSLIVNWIAWIIF